MKNIYPLINHLLISCSLLVSASSYASVVDHLSDLNRENFVFPTSDFNFLVHDDIFFTEDPTALSNLDVQVSAKLITKKDLQNEYSAFNLDNIAHRMSSSDLALISKSVGVFRNVKFNYFTASRISKPEYVSHSIPKSRNTLLSSSTHVFKQENDLKLNSYISKTIVTKNRCSSYNFQAEENHGQMMSEEMALHYVKNFDMDQPDLVNSVHAGPKDVSIGSYGFRTVNFYYNINDKDTLLVSYKVFSLKKEFFLFGSYWDKLQQDAMDNIMKVTEWSFRNLRSYLFESSSVWDENL